jgi:hypothetical protein
VKFNTIFAFRPIAPRSLAAAGAAFQVPLIIEIILFQLFYMIFQFVWIGFSIPWYIGMFILELISAGLFLCTSVSINVYKALSMYLVGANFVPIGLLLSLLFILFSCAKMNRFQNFSNYHSLFAFVSPNRSFGLNFAPGSKFFSLVINIGSTRVRLVESSFRRLETLILFTSQLRLDPKQVDLSYW